MKWFMLLLLFSCGKDNYPSLQDFRDFDGDSILNEFEKSLGTNENISDMEDLPLLQGKILISADSHRGDYLALDVSNTMDMRELQKIATARITLLENLEIIDDWSRLWIKDGKTIPVQPNQEYRLKFSFPDHERLPPFMIAFIHEGKEVFAKPWSSLINFTLSSLELKAVASGKSYFRLYKKDDIKGENLKRIKEKTYQVLFNDGSRSRVLHVSRNFEFSKLLELLEIQKISDIDEEDFLLAPEIEQNIWWMRNLKNGDKLIVNTNLKSLKSWHLQGYKNFHLELKRNNGAVTTNVIDFPKHFNSNLILKIDATKVIKDFRDLTDRGTQNGIDRICRMICSCYKREAYNERTEKLSLEEFFKDFVLVIDHERVDPLADKRISVITNPDRSGQFIELYLTSPAHSVKVSLMNKDAASYDWVGVVFQTCTLPRANRVIKSTLNSETSLSVKIEAMVEELGETI